MRTMRMEEDDGISCCKFGISFFPMPAPLLYTEIGAGGMCNAHSGWKRTTRHLLTDGGHDRHVGVLRDVAAVAV